jgi:ATP-dependent Clp protease ATP-binding subunit ClpA
VDLIDESASHLKISLENKPQALDEAHRKIMRLEIEREALKKDVEADKGARARSNIIEKEIADLKEGTSELELKWKNEKDIISEIKIIKKELDVLRIDAENAEARADKKQKAKEAAIFSQNSQRRSDGARNCRCGQPLDGDSSVSNARRRSSQAFQNGRKSAQESNRPNRCCKQNCRHHQAQPRGHI